MAKKLAKKPTSTTRAKEATTSPAPAVTAPARTANKRRAAQPSLIARYLSARNFKTLSVSAIIAELLGTFAFVLIFMTVQGSQLFLFFAYIALLLVFARVNGPHFNPAITIGLWAVRKLNGINTVAFVVAQILGAMLALIVASALVPDTVNQLTGQSEAGKVFTSQPLPEANNDLWRALAVEAIGSVILAFGAAAALLTKRDVTAKAFTIAGAYLIGLLIFQASQILNPAVALGLQAIKFELWPLAIYVLTPIAGSIVGFSLYRFMQRETDSSSDSAVDDDVVVTRVRV